MDGGKHLVFSSFSKNMDKLPDVNETVMQCATFLCESKDINKGSWQVFSQQFFRYYRKTILAYYGYEEAEFQVPLKKVIKPFFFFAVMSALYEIGLFDCSLQGLADTLYLSFDLGKMRTTCRRSFYDILPQYEFLFDYFKDLKDTGKIEK